MVTHSSILSWEIPWTEEPDRLQSTKSLRVGRDLATKELQQRCCVAYCDLFLLIDKESSTVLLYHTLFSLLLINIRAVCISG